MRIIDIGKQGCEIFKYIGMDEDRILYCQGEEVGDAYKAGFYFYENEKEVCIAENIETIDFYNIKISKFGKAIIFSLPEKRGVSVYRIDIESGRLEKKRSFEIDENHEAWMDFLGRRYAVFHIDKADSSDPDYSLKKEMDGEYRFSYMVDMETSEKYRIYDERIIEGIRDHIVYYEFEGEGYVMLEEAYMDDWEKEEIYRANVKNNDFNNKLYKESVNLIRMNKLLEDVRAKKSEISFEELAVANFETWTRYFGMDEKHIYLRVKDFESEVERVMSVDKRSFECSLLGSYDHKEDVDLRVRYDMDKQKVYMEEKKNESMVVKGLLGSNVRISYDSSFGDFDTIIEERYLITYDWDEDENDDYHDYVGVLDMETGEKMRYEGTSQIVGSTLIIY